MAYFHEQYITQIIHKYTFWLMKELHSMLFIEMTFKESMIRLAAQQ